MFFLVVKPLSSTIVISETRALKTEKSKSFAHKLLYVTSYFAHSLKLQSVVKRVQIESMSLDFYIKKVVKLLTSKLEKGTFRIFLS